MAPDRRARAQPLSPPGPSVVPAPRLPRDVAVLDALLARARREQLARPRSARVLADVVDQLLDERSASARAAAAP